jgi:hypothetical protein
VGPLSLRVREGAHSERSVATDPCAVEPLSDNLSQPISGGIVPEHSDLSRATSPAKAVREDATRSPVEHRVKSWPHLFEATVAGVKNHELRRASDRDYRVGDTLRLQEFDPVARRYTARELTVRITYITSAKFPCALSEGALHPDFCILSIAKL